MKVFLMKFGRFLIKLFSILSVFIVILPIFFGSYFNIVRKCDEIAYDENLGNLKFKISVEDFLKKSNDVVGKIYIPRINVSSPIYYQYSRDGVLNLKRSGFFLDTKSGKNISVLALDTGYFENLFHLLHDLDSSCEAYVDFLGHNYCCKLEEIKIVSDLNACVQKNKNYFLSVFLPIDESKKLNLLVRFKAISSKIPGDDYIDIILNNMYLSVLAIFVLMMITSNLFITLIRLIILAGGRKYSFKDKKILT